MKNVINFYKSDLGKAWVARAHAEFLVTWATVGLTVFTVLTIVSTVSK